MRMRMRAAIPAHKGAAIFCSGRIAATTPTAAAATLLALPAPPAAAELLKTMVVATMEDGRRTLSRPGHFPRTISTTAEGGRPGAIRPAEY